MISVIRRRMDFQSVRKMTDWKSIIQFANRHIVSRQLFSNSDAEFAEVTPQECGGAATHDSISSDRSQTPQPDLPVTPVLRMTCGRSGFRRAFGSQPVVIMKIDLLPSP